MKQLFVILILLKLALNVNSQNFELSEVDNNTSMGQVSFVHLLQNQKDTISTYKVYSAESDIEQYIEVSELNGLEGFKTKIKVEIHSTACCTSIQTYYLLIDTNDKIEILPGLQNYQCDGPEPKFDLVFPDQEYGKSNTILKAKLMFDKKYNLSNIEEISKLYYNGNNFIEIFSIKN